MAYAKDPHARTGIPRGHSAADLKEVLCNGHCRWQHRQGGRGGAPLSRAGSRCGMLRAHALRPYLCFYGEDMEYAKDPRARRVVEQPHPCNG